MKIVRNLFRNLTAQSIVILNNESIFVDNVEVVANETTTLKVVVSQDPLFTYLEIALLLLIALSTIYLAYKVWKYFKEKEEQEQLRGEQLKKEKLKRKEKNKGRRGKL